MYSLLCVVCALFLIFCFLVPSPGGSSQNNHKTQRRRRRTKQRIFFLLLSRSLSLILSLILFQFPHIGEEELQKKWGGREIQNGKEPEESAFFLSFSVLSRLNLKERKDFHLRHSRGGPGRRRWRDDGGTD